MARDLPIEPGSEVDTGIDMLLRISLRGGQFDPPIPVTQLATIRLIDIHNAAHMLALGTRLKLHLDGVTDPGALVSDVFDQWYGKAIE